MNNEEPIKYPEAKSVTGILFPAEHTVAFYTFVSILLKMKKELGLEAMLEYMVKYLTMIDSHNPKVAVAVGKALNVLPVDLIFNELTKYDKPN
jgi:hypothetical protein